MPHPIPTRLNLAFSLGMLVLHALALLAVPLWLLPMSAAWILVLILPALLSPMLWSLIHEAVHGLLHPRPGVNALLGRALAVAFGAPFRPLRFAHLRHHRYNRTSIARDEVYDETRTPRWHATLEHHLRLLGGLYAAEVALNLLCWLPRPLLARIAFLKPPPEWPQATAPAQRLADRELLSAPARWEMRLDALAVLILYGTAFWLFGAWWPTLLCMLLLRGLLISALDNAYHHATPLAHRPHEPSTAAADPGALATNSPETSGPVDSAGSGAVPAHLFALNLRASVVVRGLLLNMNLHRAHHRDVRLPWHALPAHADAHADDIGFWEGVLRQWRGPVPAGQLRESVVP
ncbi:MAG TPA: fatty acid desaturase [Xanthomonadaceae bacterium]|nr:fatty acid desaturase [Xanthomonadaceae bacterium]